MNIQGEKQSLLGTESVEYCQHNSYMNSRTLKICCFPFVLVIMALTCGILFSFYMPYYHGDQPLNTNHTCTDQCVIRLVETIPDNLTFLSNTTINLSTGKTLIDLVLNAKKSIDIASYYWSLRGIDLSYHDNSSKVGEDLFAALLDAGKSRNISIRIVQNLPSKSYPDNDTAILAAEGNAVVRTINFTRLIGDGILHTKMWLIDGQHYYVGSANLDWRSYTQVKELGVVVRNCSCLSRDMMKIFDVYWYLADTNRSIPSEWPSHFSTDINESNPELVTYNKRVKASIYLSSSPPKFCPSGRTDDLTSILTVIKQAKYFIYVAVMDYFPTTLYDYPRKYWADIDDALRHAAFDRRVRVRVMASNWSHSRPDMKHYLQSLQDISMKHVNVQVKLFEVPTYTKSQSKIPYARVNHNKYMVTDKHAYIGTSNWSGDYFINTGGIGFILRSNNVNKTNQDIRLQLKDVFNRDWYSEYAHQLTRCINTTSILHHNEL